MFEDPKGVLWRPCGTRNAPLFKRRRTRGGGAQPAARGLRRSARGAALAGRGARAALLNARRAALPARRALGFVSAGFSRSSHFRAR